MRRGPSHVVSRTPYLCRGPDRRGFVVPPARPLSRPGVVPRSHRPWRCWRRPAWVNGRARCRALHEPVPTERIRAQITARAMIELRGCDSSSPASPPEISALGPCRHEAIQRLSRDPADPVGARATTRRSQQGASADAAAADFRLGTRPPVSSARYPGSGPLPYGGGTRPQSGSVHSVRPSSSRPASSGVKPT
jgi:hypothetical protein